jgi:putative transposase
MIRTYKYLLRPNKQQDAALDFLLWQSRLVYNAALEERIRSYQETGRRLGFFKQGPAYAALRHQFPDTIGKINAHCLNQTLRRLEKAYEAFFRRIKAGKKPGFPKFKKRSAFKSIEFEYGNGCKLQIAKNGRVRFYIQNVGVIRFCYHRPIPENANIKRATLLRINKRWYVCLMLEIPALQPITRPPFAIGVDIGLKSLLAFSDGTLIENPRWLRQKQIRLRILLRRASRRHRGSHRQGKAYRQVALLYEDIAHQRRDYLHKVTCKLVNQYALVAIEDLSMAFMNQNKHLAFSSYDAGFGLFRELLTYKAETAEVQIIAVDPAYTSQLCSGCGERVEKDLNTRVHDCPFCGLVMDRDVNAARNILQAALQVLNSPD